MRSLLITCVLLSGCCPVNLGYVKADEKKYEAVAPYYLAKVAEDEASGKLSKLRAEIKRKSMKSWKARIDRALAEASK